MSMSKGTGEYGASLEDIRCPLCNRDEPQLRFWARDRMTPHVGPGRYRIVQCHGCGLVYANPRPPVTCLSAYYEADLPIHRLKPLHESNQVWARLFRRWARRQAMGRIGWIERHARPFTAGDRVLDVGCGTGAFLYWLRCLRQCEPCGIDFSSNVAAYVRDTLGIPFWQGRLEEVGFTAHAFDVVTMWHVIEHDPTPAVTLRKAREILKPDGVLVLEAPNVDSLSAKLFQSRALQFGHVPRHLVFYSPKTLGNLLTQCGFRVIAVSPVPLVGSLLLSTLFALGVEGVGKNSSFRARHLPAYVAVALTLPLLLVAGCTMPVAMRIVAQKREETKA